MRSVLVRSSGSYSIRVVAVATNQAHWWEVAVSVFEMEAPPGTARWGELVHELCTQNRAFSADEALEQGRTIGLHFAASCLPEQMPSF
jgi:hypothetical protein